MPKQTILPNSKMLPSQKAHSDETLDYEVEQSPVKFLTQDSAI